MSKLKSYLDYFRAKFFAKKPFREIDIFFNMVELRKILLSKLILSPGDAAIDVGAHNGLFTHLFYKCVEEHGMVFSFEPNPYVFEILKKRTCQMKNVRIEKVAVSNSSHQLITLHVHPHTIAQNSTVESKLKTPERMSGKIKKITVGTKRLDDVNFFNKRVKLIKIDVEGHEAKVLQGAEALISRDSPLVIFEYTVYPGHFEPGSLDVMQSMHYRCIDLNTLNLIEHIPAKTYITDILAIPIHQLDSFAPILSTLSQISARHRVR